MVEPRPSILDANTEYLWTAWKKEGKFELEIRREGERVQAITADAEKVKAFGFWSTVRRSGSKADLRVTFAQRR